MKDLNPEGRGSLTLSLRGSEGGRRRRRRRREVSPKSDLKRHCQLAVAWDRHGSPAPRRF
jgi:hypothetical protein